MNKRLSYFLRILIVSFGSCTVFAGIVFYMQKTAIERAVTQRLSDCANLGLELLPANYHDVIKGKESINSKKYLRIVDSFNQVCKKMGLEYIWTLMLTEKNEIVFTSGTAKSKNIAVGDFARFYEPHSDPEQYKECFATMKPVSQTNNDKWGNIKAVLIPYMSAKGRPYLVGASMKMDLFNDELRESGKKILIILTGFFVVLLPLSFYLATKFISKDGKA